MFQASSFADPADIRAFKKCKGKGYSDEHCFAVGDNGLGYWDDSTVEGTGNSCALHKSLLREKFGDDWRKKARNSQVRVTVQNKSALCFVRDICGKVDRIDLNPDAVRALGMEPPILVDASWEWVG